jgi:hypothetical protein
MILHHVVLAGKRVPEEEAHMRERDPGVGRRVALQSIAASLAIGRVALAAPSADGAGPGSGKAGDFDFLAGAWSISHRRLKTPGGNDWDVFKGEATCWTILGGVGSVEELRIPERDFSGMGLRLLDVEKRLWSDHWVNARSGVLGCPGMAGAFENGAGTFIADDVDGDRPIKVRGVWDRITATSRRWHQAISRDGGKQWEGNWFMDWVRA